MCGREGEWSDVSDCPVETLQGFLQQAARRGHVEPHIAFAAGAEHLAVVQGQLGAADKQTDQFLVAEVQGAAVDPQRSSAMSAALSNS